jgi:homogentisate 1,2-dioxygenase
MHQYTQGKYTKQAHKGIPEGYFEEEQGRQGFFGPVSHLIRKNPSTHWVNIEGDLKPRLYDLVELPKVEKFQRILHNREVAIYQYWALPSQEPKSAFRNSDGDTLYFCHKGDGVVLTDYGLLPYRRGQYIVIRKCMTHTFVPKTDSNFFVVEAREGYFGEPDRGLVGRHAIYDIANIGKPDLDAQRAFFESNKQEIKNVRIKRLDEFTTYEYSSHIYDVLGWKGDLFPFTLHTDDMMPLMSHRAHLPPSAHTTFVAHGFVVCTFLPRPLESDADALKVPFYHQNMDYDEVLFYHDGDFFSRDNLHAGMITLHPAGFPHGPHPKAMEKVKSKTHTEEYAVMVDTRFPLNIDSVLNPVEVKNYWQSWMKK